MSLKELVDLLGFPVGTLVFLGYQVYVWRKTRRMVE